VAAFPEDTNPFSQVIQSSVEVVASLLSEYVSFGQVLSVHDVTIPPVDYWPSGQSLHPIKEEYRPAGHVDCSVHVAEPSDDVSPAAQSVQLDAFAAD